MSERKDATHRRVGIFLFLHRAPAPQGWNVLTTEADPVGLEIYLPPNANAKTIRRAYREQMNATVKSGH